MVGFPGALGVGEDQHPQAPSSGASDPPPNGHRLGRPSSGSLLLSFRCRSGLRFFQPWGLWLRSSGLLFATFLLLSLFSLVAGLLLASHLYLVASNTTTWEFISSHRIAYLRQRPGNPFDRGLTPTWPTSSVDGPRGPGRPSGPRTRRRKAVAKLFRVAGSRGYHLVPENQRG